MGPRGRCPCTLTALAEGQGGLPEVAAPAGGGAAAAEAVAEVAVEHHSVPKGVVGPVPAQQLPILHSGLLTGHHCARESTQGISSQAPEGR